MDFNFNEKILDETEAFLQTALKRKADVKKILIASINSNKQSDFESIIFTSKYIQGLMRVLRKGSQFAEIENLDYVKKDLAENMEKVIGDIRGVLSNEDKTVITHFEEEYFELTQKNLFNLYELLGDLELVKKYVNYAKRKPSE